MKHLYLYTNGPRVDVLFCGALYRALLADPDLTLSIGACRGDEELLADLAGPRVNLILSEFRNGPFGAPFDLVAYRPRGSLPIAVVACDRWRAPVWQWDDLLDRFEHAAARAGVPLDLSPHRHPVPMLDCGRALPRPTLRRPSIFLDTERSVEPKCWFVYDLARLAYIFEDWDLLCTAPPDTQAANLLDISALSWPERSLISEQCMALIGSTRDPFAVTLTEANRWKPKALCGYDARVTQPFWDYPGNPMELLGTMDELVDFLLATLAERVAR